MDTINVLTLGRMCEAALNGESVFIIRAKDNLAIETIDHYFSLAVERGAQNTSRTQTASQRFLDWRRENPEKCKLPG